MSFTAARTTARARRLTVIMVAAALVAGITTTGVSPARAATTLVCPATAGQTVPTPDRLTRPPSLAAVTVRSAGGVPERAYAGMMIPQAVIHDPVVDRTYIAYFSPGAAVPSTGRTPVNTVIAAVDSAGVVRERSVLARADGTPVLFDQGAATPVSAGGNVNDSHNALTMEIDSAGYVHVAGNVHNNDLPYWRSAAPHSVAAMRWKSALPGVKVFPNGVSILAASADRVATSPRLLVGPGGRLFLSFRHWVSGDASLFLYSYDTTTSVWSSVSGGTSMPNPNPAYSYTEGRPLLDGRAQGLDGSLSLSPETSGPVRGPDGRWWLVWSWRDLASSADSNSRVSVARSSDLVTWYTVSGKRLPATIEYSLVDESPEYASLVVENLTRSGSGLLNNQIAIGWDTAKRPVISYFRYVGSGSARTTQLVAARPNGLSSAWIATPASRWTGVYDLSGGASTTVLQTSGSGAVPVAGGRLELAYQCNGVSRVLTIATGSFTGSSVFVRDDVATASNVPIEADSLPAGAPTTLAVRRAESPAVAIDGVHRRWLLTWGSGPWIVDGTAPAPGSFPTEGSPMRLVVVAVDPS